MTETRETKKASRLRQRAETGRMVVGGYFNLRARLEDAKEIPVPSEVIDSYNAHRDEIEAIYGDKVLKDSLYHGTGTFQYEGDKYAGRMGDDLRRPLDTILEHGITPHLDVWNSTPGGYLSTSLATVWSYAKVYADFHQRSDDPLLWQYGDKADWLSYIMGATVWEHLKDNVKSPRQVLHRFSRVREFAKGNKNTGDLSRLQKWVQDVRKSRPTDRTKVIFHAHTDIPGNFGAVFTIDSAKVAIAPKGPGVYEVRTVEPIKGSDFLSLAVPMNRLEEYQEKTRELGHSFPVLPMEAVDFHVSKFPFNEVTVNRKIPFSKIREVR